MPPKNGRANGIAASEETTTALLRNGQMITDTSAIEKYRLPVAAPFKGKCIGAFQVPSPLGSKTTSLNVLAHDGNEMDYLNEQVHGPRWEHVSVSVVGQRRLPTWEEMHHVKRMFWLDSETVLQFHPMESEYVNTNPMVLHLWRMVGTDHPLPPKCLV
jgi:hypothetical protein